MREEVRKIMNGVRLIPWEDGMTDFVLSFFFFIYSFLYFVIHSQKVMGNTLLESLLLYLFFAVFILQVFYSKRIIRFLREKFVFQKTGYYEPFETPFYLWIYHFSGNSSLSYLICILENRY